MRILDLYCGAGGFSEGFRQAGFDIVLAIDNNKSACNTFSYNIPDCEVICKDIKDDGLVWPNNIDVVIGSPPCTEFSKGNVNRTFDDTLINRMLEIIDEIEPRYWVLENVPDAIDYVDAPVKEILNAFEYGCATIRTRLFAGEYPNHLLKKTQGKSVQDVININRPGYRQPYKNYVYRKINPEKPYVTLCSQRISNERYLLPNGTSLTVNEMAIIQGFPKYYVFPVSRSEMQRQIGNSVCPPVAKAIAEAINEK